MCFRVYRILAVRRFFVGHSVLPRDKTLAFVAIIARRGLSVAQKLVRREGRHS